MSQSIKSPSSPKLSSHAKIFEEYSKKNISCNAIRNITRQLKRFRIRLKALLENKASIYVDEELSSDIKRVIENHRLMEEDDL